MWTLFIAIAALTYYVYPLNYWDLVRLSPVVGTVLLVRNAMLILFAFMVVRYRFGSTDSSPHLENTQ